MSKYYCKSYYISGEIDKEQHVLIPKTKLFGLIKGDICVLCSRFFIDKSYKFWRKNGY